VSNLVSTLKLTGLTKEAADAANDKITAAGGKVETHLIPTGADISRGWGVRRSVAADFLYDSPVQLGSQRAGRIWRTSARAWAMQTGSCSIFTRRKAS
jgi:hypothetical protein